MLRQAVVLAGGLGTRLGELTRSNPKPMLSVGGRPFLEYVVWNLRRHGITRLVFCVGYLAERIMKHFGDGSRFGVAIEYVVEREPAGTGGALLLARPRLDEEFLVLNGDTLFDLNYLDLGLLLEETGAVAAVALRRVLDATRYGRVRLHGSLVIGFDEKGAGGPGLVSGGVYVLRRAALDRLPGVPSSLERDLFPALAAARSLVGRAYGGFFLDIGVPESLREAQSAVPRWRQKPAVFLDRDGVLNEDRGYVRRPEDFVWVQRAPEAVKWLNDRGYLVIVVTNQAGIARGYYTEEDFCGLMEWVQAELRRRGAHLDAVYHCPHHPEEGRGPYLAACDCRKPAPGLIRRALEEWDVDVARSLMIDDREENLAAARALGIRDAVFRGGNLLEFVRGLLARDGAVSQEGTSFEEAKS